MPEELPASSRPRVFIGARIGVESERLVLRALFDYLSDHAPWSVVLANFHCDGRQIDFVVGTDRGTLLIEAKQYRWPVEGAENGLWAVRFSRGSSRPARNAYQQALDARHALKDHVGRLRDVGYPDACVVATPSLPVGSVVPSDSKVAVCGLADLPNMLRRQSALKLRESDWVDVAHSLSLEEVDELEMAFDEALAQSHRLLGMYLQEFLHVYGDIDQRLKQDDYLCDGLTLNKDDVVGAVLADATVTLIRGPSGCGKSLLGKYVAVAAARQGLVPIVIQAKYFQGELKDCLNREIALLSVSSAVQLFAAIRRLGSTCMLVVDGYNECPAEERLPLSRSVRAFSRRLGAACIVSSQIELDGAAIRGERTLLVHPPSRDLKQAIAVSAAAGATAISALSPLLEAVQTGLEADLIGQVGAELGPEAGTFAVFDRFVRKKLGDQDAEGVGFLAELAGWLVEAASFSTTTSQVDRLAHRARFPLDVRRKLIAAKVLAEQVDRVSFGHELFLQAFSAEWAVREAAGAAEAVMKTLASPRFSRCKTMIIGALDDVDLQRRVLEQLVDTDVLLAAHAGRCGETARQWATTRFRAVLDKAIQETEQLNFVGKLEGLVHAGVDPATRLSWSDQERAAVTAVTQLVRDGVLLDAFLQAVVSLDAAAARAQLVLLEEEGVSRARARSEVFQLLVLFGNDDIVLTRAVSDIASGIGDRRGPPEAVLKLIDLHWTATASPMQLYVLVQLASQQYGYRHMFAEKTAHLLRTGWRGAPYHLRLAILQLARMGHEVTEPQKNTLIEALQALPSTNSWLDSSIVDALESLGALRDEMWAQYDSIVSELRNILDRKLEPQAWDDAYQFWAKQTDDPYADAYSDAVRSLSPEDRAQLLAMACRTTSQYTFSMCFLVRELARSVVPGDAFAIDSIQSRLTLPPSDTHGSQDSVDTFIGAHEVLGRLGGPLPDPSFYELDARPERIALLGCAQLAYFHPQERSGATSRTLSPDAVALLTSAGATQALSAITLVEWARYGELRPENRFVPRFREVCVSVARQGLKESAQPVHYFDKRWVERSHRVMAVSILERYGDRSDLGLLRGLVDDGEIGAMALAAIAKLEGV